jgi:predicted TIM-barrel fold metal-dependent hydrolase
MIIDAHVHIHPNPKGFGDRYDASIETLLKSLDQSEVDKAVVLPIVPKVSNEFIEKACRDHPNQLIGFVSVNPVEGEKALDDFDRNMDRFPFKGLKLHPRLQGFSLNDPRIIPVLQRAGERNVPVLIDAFPYGSGSIARSLPLLLDEVAYQVPKTKIIMAHMGGYRFMDGMAVALSNKNVYVDISYILPFFENSIFEKMLEFAIKKVGTNRIIYGSDHPELPLQETFNRTKAILNRFNLTNKDLELIFGGTIQTLLGL